MAWVADFTFVGDITVASVPDTPGVMAACFKSMDNKTGVIDHALIVWSPTSNATILPRVTLPVSGDACPVTPPSSNVRVVIPVAPLLRGNVSSAPVDSSGFTAVTVSEMPTIILASSAQPSTY